METETEKEMEMEWCYGSGGTQLRCPKGTCLWVTDMWASHLLDPHVIDTKAGALRH